MQISQNTVVSIDYTLKDDSGTVLDSSEGGDALVYLHGVGQLIPGLESALEGKTQGDELSVRVEPKDAYGDRDNSKQQQVPREMFGAHEIQVGEQYHASSPDGDTIVVTVAEISEEHITVDGNHPLAGVALNFDVKVVDVREATEEEIAHGHVHGPDGHHH